MPTNPASIALGSEKFAAYLENTAREIELNRAQSLEPSVNINTEQDFELGNVDPIGSSTDPAEPRVAFEQFDVNCATELLLAGLAVNGTSITLAQLFSDNDIVYYEPVKNTAGTIIHERKITGCAVADATWTMPATGQVSKSITLEGTGFTTLTSGMHAWPSGDAVSVSSIRGKDAVVFIGGTFVGADTMWRVQNCTIRATRPNQTVRELGNRSITGRIATQPATATIDFEILEADLQPETLLLTSQDFNLTATQDIVVRLYDPTDNSRAALGSVTTGAIKSFKLENCKISSATVSRAQVRGLGTKRFSLVVTLATTASSGGMLIYDGDPA